MCFFGLKDPENGKPDQKPTILEVNDSAAAKNLLKQAYCKHHLGEHH